MFPHRAKVFGSVDDFLIELKATGQINRKIILTSGGYGIIHQGHLECLQDSAKLDLEALLVVVVNGDDWLRRKKGFIVMSEAERAEMVACVSGVDYVIIWDDGSPTVCGAIEKIKPTYFTKGGDRDTPTNIPEYSVCQKVGCQVVFGVGGGKIQSSSNIIAKVEEHFLEQLRLN